MRPLFSALGVVAAVVLSTGSCAQETDKVIGRGYPYAVAFIDSHPEVLRLFPLSGGQEERELPADLSPFAYSPDGRSLYGFQTRTRPGLLKVELDSMRLSVVPGSIGLPGAAGIAVSGDGERFILSGSYYVGGSTRCGLFELRPSTESFSLLVENGGCVPRDGLSMWTGLSLSPDGERVVARGGSGLRIVDLVKRTATPLSEDYEIGAWSPDGKWLSVVEDAGQRRTVLMDAKTLKVERTFVNSAALWSPDSRYLLALAPDSCGPYWFTFQAVDVVTGQRVSATGSRCKVNLNTGGWVSLMRGPAESHP